MIEQVCESCHPGTGPLMDAPIDLGAFAPDYCGNGHRLGPGQILLSWSPCSCPAANENFRGHHSIRCTACHDAGVEMIYLNPPDCEVRTRGRPGEPKIPRASREADRGS